MAKNKGNKVILEISEATKNNLKMHYLNNDYKSINKELEYFMHTCKVTDKIPNKYSNYSNYNYLTVSLGNTKLKKGFLTLNVGCALFCCMDILNKCNNCKICYAKSHNKRHFKNTVPKNCINQITLNKVLLGEINLHTVLYNTIYNIMSDLSETEINNNFNSLKELRINVESDILNDEVLLLINKIANVLISVFNLNCAYSYTHNKDLNLSLAKNINFNTSDFKINGYNQFKTIDKLDFETRQKIINNEVFLCLGNCSDCNYCKYCHNKDILVLKHGNGYKGVTDEVKVWFAYMQTLQL